MKKIHWYRCPTWQTLGYYKIANMILDEIVTNRTSNKPDEPEVEGVPEPEVAT